ncbi:hypothetical protein [Actinomarinicola tropica]|uniref:Uncharacterized protein n=1 Tax=Actinomarinicola tropica TaxID=2789776 RepID=A0A5Q2RFH1_9ACTN|nr:hypothetical protein [Actinomarinicola tropica]QGG94384.1 hypothetical protein GH723_04290 [Actinomarinicola tropica]
MCGYVRYVVAAWIAGLSVTSVTGSDGWGALAALVAVAVTFVVTRAFPARFAPSACSVEPSAR